MNLLAGLMLGSKRLLGYWCGCIESICWVGGCGVVSVVGAQSKVEVSSLFRSRGVSSFSITPVNWNGDNFDR